MMPFNENNARIRSRCKWFHCMFRKRGRNERFNRKHTTQRTQHTSANNAADEDSSAHGSSSSTAEGTLVSVSASAMKRKRKERRHKKGEWMCNCCGAVFPSYEIADVHEDECVRLFWQRNFVQNGAAGRLPVAVATDIIVSPIIGNELSFPAANRDRTWSNMTGDSDVVGSTTVSTTGGRTTTTTTTTKTHSKKREKGKGVLAPPTVHAICNLINTKLVKYLLSPAEVEAERKLEMMRQERIRLAEEEQAKRTRRQDDAFIVSHVKRKLQEAFTLIRDEGTGEGMNGARADQYTRHEYDKLGDIPHGGDTLYVNVIVKQSVRVSAFVNVFHVVQLQARNHILLIFIVLL